MSDGFLKRWSRRKRTEDPPPAIAPAERPPSNLPPQAGEGFRAAGEGSTFPPPRSGGGEEGVAPPTKPLSESEEQEIDPATLPPIESLGADSDYTVFLKKGVPEALRIAALRKAWVSDPFIRDFRSPAIEYGWDFTTPEYNLRATDDVAKLLDQIFPPKAKADAADAATDTATDAAADAGAKPEIEPPPEASVPGPRSIAAPAPDLSLPQSQVAQAEPAGPAKEPERAPVTPRRRHGGALPD